jgi:NAD(P) transhydrogenase subunit alpha
MANPKVPEALTADRPGRDPVIRWRTPVRIGLMLLSTVLLAPGLAGQEAAVPEVDFWSMLFVFVLASFIGLGVIRRVSRLLHTPLMSLTNAISAIAVVGSIIVAGGEFPTRIRVLGAIALFASMTNIVSGFLITDRMLKMFKTEDKRGGGGHA